MKDSWQSCFNYATLSGYSARTAADELLRDSGADDDEWKGWIKASDSQRVSCDMLD